MSLAVSYLGDLARVRITGADMPGEGVLLERSTDRVRWEPVRGGAPVEVAGGGFVLDDYEFTPGVVNYYRATPAAVPVDLGLSGSLTTGGGGVDVDFDWTQLSSFSLANRMVRLTLTVNDVNRLNETRLFIGLNGTFQDTLRWSFFHRTSAPDMGKPGEAFQIDLKLSEVSSAFGSITLDPSGVPSTLSGFTAVRLRVADDAAGPVTVTIHRVELVPMSTTRGYVSVCFDDGLASVPALAKPKLDTLGLVATNYPVVGRVDSGANWQTTADLAAMVAAGWEIGGHANDPAVHTSTYTAVDSATAAADMAANLAWLKANYPHPAGLHTMAYPQGAYEDTTDGVSVESLVRRAGYISGRTTLARVGETSHVQIAGIPEVMPYRIHALSGISEVTDSPGKPADLLAPGGMLDKVEANGGWLILTFHEIVTGTPAEGNEIRQSDFDALMDGIAARDLGVVTVRDGLSAVHTAEITPVIDTVWLKSTVRPFLNRPVTVEANAPTVTRPARNGVFPIVGRTLPIAVTDVRMSRRVTLSVITADDEQRRVMDLVLAAGDPMVVQAPPGCPVETMHVVIEDTSESPTSRRGPRRRFELPVIEVAPPPPGLSGHAYMWSSVGFAYGAWSAVAADNATWADVLARVADPEEVIVR